MTVSSAPEDAAAQLVRAAMTASNPTCALLEAAKQLVASGTAKPSDIHELEVAMESVLPICGLLEEATVNGPPLAGYGPDRLPTVPMDLLRPLCRLWSMCKPAPAPLPSTMKATHVLQGVAGDYFSRYLVDGVAEEVLTWLADPPVLSSLRNAAQAANVESLFTFLCDVVALRGDRGEYSSRTQLIALLEAKGVRVDDASVVLPVLFRDADLL
eukprot:CAMPEP_0177642836 /NCGR_PEP_ID=MMETSP0447-20121125/7828_1 /TAXON_ID=0 /ORGANISM="Stygamoeba regulata, Strain BSH-02190019" /LENGTH=212 /DNA_ID=CAMNT_0019145079 /DNA_START=114 /DNA_END=749 /DNA_ORIENTATION=+